MGGRHASRAAGTGLQERVVLQHRRQGHSQSESLRRSCGGAETTLAPMKQKLHCAYLFADGHAVLVYEKHDRQAGDIRWAEVVEKFGPECRFTGRIVFH